GAAVGQLLGSDARVQLVALISGWCSVFILAVSSWCYSEVTSAIPGVERKPEVVFLASFSLYLSAVVAGAACTIIAARTKHG
ncbi:MAG: hypothetical protein MN733_00690, partial [Nitrososphaera sp.]|nr:hypothetical protein [Nitrososphaera sp.]